jgi:hypothetical protein
MGFWQNIFSKKVKNDQNVNVEEKTTENNTVEIESTNNNTVEIKVEKTEEVPNELAQNIIASEVVILPKNETDDTVLENEEVQASEEYPIESFESEASVVVDEAHEIEDDGLTFVPVTESSFVTPQYTEITEGDFEHAII